MSSISILTDFRPSGLLLDTPRKFILDECSVLFSLFMILLVGILSPGQLMIPVLMLAVDSSFLLGSFKLNQSDVLSINKKINFLSIKRKTPTIMAWIYMINTRLWSFRASLVAQRVKRLPAMQETWV